MLNEETPQIPLTFSPLPLLTGNVAGEGEPKAIQTITVTVTDVDGNQSTTELVKRNGGWWAPTA